MDREDDLLRQIEALRERLSRLSDAGLRINESLDFDTVLQGVLDSARVLTEARYGVITLLDESGQVQDSLSSGLTPEEAEGVWGQGSAGLEVFKHLNSFQEPLRVPDLFGHIRSMGLPNLSPPMPVGPAFPFLAAPVFHWGERFGNIFLAKRERGDEFTQEDEETLQMFASQAAMVMANARRYRRRAAGQERPGDPGRHLSRGCCGLRRQNGDPGVVQPGGGENDGRAADSGRGPGASPGDYDRTAVRWT